MRKKASESLPVVEWSPTGVRAAGAVGAAVIEVQTLEEALTALGRPKLVGLAISRRHALIRTIRLPNVSKEDAGPALRLQLDRCFPIPSEDLAADFIFLDDVTTEGRLALLVAVKVEILKAALAELREFGVKPAWIAPSALGSQALAEDIGVQQGLVLEATPEGLSLDVIKDGHLVYSRVGGTRLSAIDMQAEAARTLATSEIDSPQVIATGGLTFPTAHRTTPIASLSELCHHDAGVLNLVLPEEKAREENKKLRSRGQLTALLGVVCLGTALLVWDSWDQQAQKVKAIEARFARSQKAEDDARKAAESRVAESESGAKVLKNAFLPAQPATDVLTLAANKVPAGAWLTNVRFERGKPLDIRGVTLKGDQAAAYVDALAATGRLRDVKLVFANNSDIEDTSVVQFAISAHVIGNLPLVEKKKKKAAARRPAAGSEPK